MPTDEAAPAEHRDYLPTLQFGRALAAAMVLYFHCQAMLQKFGATPDLDNAGAAGVDIFFVISGFVIFLVCSTSQRQPGLFLLKRLIRIVPPYWLYTTLVCVILVVMPQLYRTMQFDTGFAVSSYLFILSAHDGAGPGVLLGVGWTLAFEVYFYLLTVVALWLLPKNPLALLSVAIIGGAVASFCIGAPPFAVVAVSALPLEFLAGCFIARFYRGGHKVPLWSSAPLFAIGLIVIHVAGRQGLVTDSLDPARVVWFGGSAVAIVLALVAVDRHVRIPAVLLLLGDASYSLYLCHQFALEAAGRFFIGTGLSHVIPLPGIFVLAFTVAQLAGVASYLLLERPLVRWVRRQLIGRSDQLAAAPEATLLR